MWTNPSSQTNSTYQGKEFQMGEWQNGDLGLYDFGARLYNPVLARWQCADPMDQFDSPYNAMGNNPVINIDPDGMFSIPWGAILSNVGTALSSVKQSFTSISLPFMTKTTHTYAPFANAGSALNIAGTILSMGMDAKAILDAAGQVGGTLQNTPTLFDQINHDLASNFAQAWKDSFINDKSSEHGGVIVRDQNGKIMVRGYHGGSSEEFVQDYSSVMLGDEILGDFHTHPYSSKEIKREQRLIKSFDGLGEPFTDSDLSNYGTRIKKETYGKGDILFVIAGDVIYGLEITNVSFAKSFLTDGTFLDAVANSSKYIDINTDYGEANWSYLLQQQVIYENGNAGSSGVIFRKLSIMLNK